VSTALKNRKTIREIGERKLSLQILSDLLWAACGVNRKKGPFGIPGRTAASASNSQEIDVLCCLQEATWLYDAIHHTLIPAVEGDLRPLAIGKGQQSFGDKLQFVLFMWLTSINLLILQVIRNRDYRIPKFRNHTILPIQA